MRDETRLSGWVFQVARNVLRDHYGRRKKENPLPVFEGDDKELNLQVASWLGVFVEGLPEAYREPVDFADLRGLSHAEIGRRLGLSLTAVKSRVRRGREMLRKTLFNCCRFELDRRGNVIDVQGRDRPCAETSCGCGSTPLKI